MTKILCTRNIPKALIHQAAINGIDLKIKEFITVLPGIQQNDLPTINALLQEDDAIVIFTSKHAVHAIADYFYKNKPDGISLRWKIYCISEVTLSTVREHFPNTTIHGKAAYAADLANILLKQEKAEDVYFFCGNKRRDTLPDALRGKNIRVNEMVVYTTSLTPHLVRENYEGILFFSPSAVESYFSVNKIRPSTACFAIGKTTAAAILKHTNNEVLISQRQDAEEMIKTVIHYFIKNE